MADAAEFGIVGYEKNFPAGLFPPPVFTAEALVRAGFHGIGDSLGLRADQWDTHYAEISLPAGAGKHTFFPPPLFVFGKPKLKRDYVLDRMVVDKSREITMWEDSNVLGLAVWEIELRVDGKINEHASRIVCAEQVGSFVTGQNKSYPPLRQVLPITACRRRPDTGAYYYTFQKPAVLKKQNNFSFVFEYQSSTPFNAIAMLHGYTIRR